MTTTTVDAAHAALTERIRAQTGRLHGVLVDRLYEALATDPGIDWEVVADASVPGETPAERRRSVIRAHTRYGWMGWDHRFALHSEMFSAVHASDPAEPDADVIERVTTSAVERYGVDGADAELPFASLLTRVARLMVNHWRSSLAITAAFDAFEPPIVAVECNDNDNDGEADADADADDPTPTQVVTEDPGEPVVDRKRRRTHE